MTYLPSWRSSRLVALALALLLVPVLGTPTAVAVPGDDECAGGVDAPDSQPGVALAAESCTGSLYRGNGTGPESDLYDAYRIRVDGQLLAPSVLELQICKEPGFWMFYNVAYRSDFWVETSKAKGIIAPDEACHTPEPFRYNSTQTKPGFWLINTYTHENGLLPGQAMNYTLHAQVIE